MLQYEEMTLPNDTFIFNPDACAVDMVLDLISKPKEVQYFLDLLSVNISTKQET